MSSLYNLGIRELVKTVANDIIDAFDEESLKIRSESFKIGVNGKIYTNQFNIDNNEEKNFALRGVKINSTSEKKNCCV